MTTDEWKTPDCPGCGKPPQMALSEQCFCGNTECRVLTWNPTRTAGENMADMNLVELQDWLGR